jgi:hypothetical protein
MNHQQNTHKLTLSFKELIFSVDLEMDESVFFCCPEARQDRFMTPCMQVI